MRNCERPMISLEASDVRLKGKFNFHVKRSVLQISQIADFFIKRFRQAKHGRTLISSHEITTLSKRCHYDYKPYNIKKSIFILTSVKSLDIIKVER